MKSTVPPTDVVLDPTPARRSLAPDLATTLVPLRPLGVCVTRGAAAGAGHCALSSQPIRVGSDPDNDLAIDDRHASRNHCEIFLRDGRPWIRDLQSTHGTYVDANRIVESALRMTSCIEIGGTELRLRPLESDASPSGGESHACGEMVGYSPAMQQFFSVLRSVAGTSLSCLLLGETGTGKELAARALHERSKRADRPFLVVDCAAIGPQFLDDKLFGHERGAFTGATSTVAGVFEEARGGTVLLDEIGELPLPLQAKLLGVLERREATRIGSNTPIELDIRLISVTHRDPSELAKVGRFRPDLLDRIAEITLRMPALRERKEDIGVIADETLEREGHGCELSRDAIEYLQEQPWPGNIPELQNVIRRAASRAQDSVIDRNLLRSLDEETAHIPRLEYWQRHVPCSLTPPPTSWLPAGGSVHQPDFDLPLADATENFREAYVRFLRRRFGDDLHRAAAHAGTHPKSVSRLFRLYRVY